MHDTTSIKIENETVRAHWLHRIPYAGPIFFMRPRWIAAVLIGIFAYLFMPTLPGHLKWIAAWDIGVIVFLASTAATLGRASAYRLRQRARRLDQGATTILVLTLAGVSVSLFAIVAGIKEAKVLNGHGSSLPIALAAATIILSWVLTQVIFAIHYAHLFYGDDPEDETRHAGGLDFPGGDHPDALDFAYFSFVIGMTFQVSDVEISEKPLRRIATLHGILSFLFNTVILALAVNIASSLLG